VTAATMLTENAYCLCDQHLAAWRAGGWDGDAWAIEADDLHFGVECADCDPCEDDGHDDYYRAHVLDVCPDCGRNAYFENVAGAVILVES